MSRNLPDNKHVWNRTHIWTDSYIWAWLGIEYWSDYYSRIFIVTILKREFGIEVVRKTPLKEYKKRQYNWTIYNKT